MSHFLLNSTGSSNTHSILSLTDCSVELEKGAGDDLEGEASLDANGQSLGVEGR